MAVSVNFRSRRFWWRWSVIGRRHTFIVLVVIGRHHASEATLMLNCVMSSVRVAGTAMGYNETGA